MKQIKIYIAAPEKFSNQAINILKEAGQIFFDHTRQSGIREAIKDFDVVWLRLSDRVTREMINKNNRCCVIACPVTGIDHIDAEACSRYGIKVISLKGETEFLKEIRATAELTIGITLALIRKIPEAVNSVRQGAWKRDLFQGTELYGKTVGIVGMGRLGKIVAGYFKAFKMNVLGYDIRPDFPDDLAIKVNTLDDLISKSDIVSLHVNYDDTTRNLIGKEELSYFKPGSILINTSRGGVVDQQALIDVLNKKQLAGAAVDVLDGEPDITEDHPLINYANNNSNLLIVPHIGGNTKESFEKTEVFIAKKVVEYLKIKN
ncbi:MAG: hypothetical protein FVQ77_01300 [Cytophagales bacterium]|nr:hypothetical protein [Cytophagales bacterium]